MTQITAETITAEDLQKILVKYTVDNSHFDSTRSYISLSNMYKEPDELINDYHQGYEADEIAKMKCYKGYQMEADIVKRLRNSLVDDRLALATGIELEIKTMKKGDVPFKGHPDFGLVNPGAFNTIPQLLGDCKSVLRDDWLPKHRVPRKVYIQAQSYMLASGHDKFIVIYESRQSGLIRCYMIKKNIEIQMEINDKINAIRERMSS